MGDYNCGDGSDCLKVT